MKQLLTFNPVKRASAKDLLNSDIFSTMRVKTLEEDADVRIQLELDDLDLFDYEECVDHLPIEKCHEILIQEIKCF
jgi:hypothetical protein